MEKVMWTYGNESIMCNIDYGFFNTKKEAIADRKKTNVDSLSEKVLKKLHPIRKVYFVNSADTNKIEVIKDALLKSIASIKYANGTGYEFCIEDLDLKLWVEKGTSPFGIAYHFVSLTKIKYVMSECSWCDGEEFLSESLIERIAQNIYNIVKRNKRIDYGQ